MSERPSSRRIEPTATGVAREARRGPLYARRQVYPREALMVVRVARFRQQSERFTGGSYHWVLDALRECEGFHAAYDVVDPSTGDSISVGIFENAESLRTAEEMVCRGEPRDTAPQRPPATAPVPRKGSMQRSSPSATCPSAGRLRDALVPRKGVSDHLRARRRRGFGPYPQRSRRPPLVAPLRGGAIYAFMRGDQIEQALATGPPVRGRPVMISPRGASR